MKNEKMLFLSNFIKNPKEVGSAFSSSKFLCRKIMKQIDFEEGEFIVELGAGTGPVTKELLKNLRTGSKLMCFDINSSFCSYIKGKINDSRLIVINDDAKHLREYLDNKVKFIVSVLPFFLMDEETKCGILSEVREALAENGKFILIQYTASQKKYLKKYFSKVKSRFVPLNMPPSFIFICEK